MARTIVGVLRGGTSSEYDLSLKTGAAMHAALPEEKYETRDILIDKQGMWHLRGIPVEPARALSQVDVVLNALHGGVGEDGTVQRLLARAGVPFAGSRPLSSGFALNKAHTHDICRKAGIAMPRTAIFNISNPLNTAEMAESIFQQFGPPYIVKPVHEGSSVGVLLIETIVELPEAIADTLDRYGVAMVQEFILGDEVVVGLVEGFRGEELYALPPAHVVLPEGERYLASHHIQDGSVRYLVPSNFSHADKRELLEAARAAHRALNLSHFSTADLILKRGRPYLLELNTSPHLYEGATFPAMLASVGSSLREFLEHSIALARM